MDCNKATGLGEGFFGGELEDERAQGSWKFDCGCEGAAGFETTLPDGIARVLQQDAIGAEAKSREEAQVRSDVERETKAMRTCEPGCFAPRRMSCSAQLEDVARSGADFGCAEDGGGGEAGFYEIESGGEFCGENGGEVGSGSTTRKWRQGWGC